MGEQWPAVKAEELRRLLRDHAPVIKEDGGPVVVYTSPYDACRDADAVLITTEWDEFRNTPAPPPAGNKGPGTGPSRNLGQQQQKELQKPRHIDPRPFERLEPTESDLLALHRYLVATGASASKQRGPGDTIVLPPLSSQAPANPTLAVALPFLVNSLQYWQLHCIFTAL